MNPVAEYQKSAKLTMRGLAVALGIKSYGHACDLVNGRRSLTVPLAKRLAELTGRPWYELMSVD